MRVTLVAHGFPPAERTGVENYTAWLAAALARAGCTVEVFAPRRRPDLPQHSVRREDREGYGVTWLTCNEDPLDPSEALDPPGVARAFGHFLESERPEVVHFQHVVKLGVSLMEVAAERGLPVVYTAHDYYAVCHRYTLLRPDLERCETVGDPEVCARCDLALAQLHRVPGLGDYQVGVFPDQLGEEDRAGLAAALAGDDVGAGFPSGEAAAALVRRRALDQRRARAFAAVDLVLAPTRYLRDRLVAGGMESERIEVLPYGIDTARFAGLASPAIESGRSVRFGYLGGLSKQKGVHVLLDAFDRLREPAELCVWGHTTDAAHLAKLRARASDVGARWMGAYRAEDLAGLLAEVDVVVVPSIWVENQPIVIREAFAARRPVIASDLGAIPESVRDGVDGLLFEPGSSDSLAAALARCVREEGLVARLTAGIDPVKDADAQATELLAIYTRLCGAAPRPSTDLPTSLVSFAARHDALSALPTRDLFARVLAGLGQLRAGLGGTVAALAPEVVLREAFRSGDHARELLRDNRTELEWVRERERALEARQVWLEEVLEDRAREADERRRQAEQADRGRDAVQEECDWLRGHLEVLEAERDWMVERLEGQEAELVWLRETVSAKDAELGALRSDLDHGRQEMERIVRKLEGLAQKLAQEEQELIREELKLKREEQERKREEQERKRAQDRLEQLLATLDAAFRRLEVELEVPLGPPIQGADRSAADAEGEDPRAAALLASIRNAGERAGVLRAELEWRQEEMRALVLESRRRLASLLVGRTGLGRRLRRWHELEDGDGGGLE